MSYVKCEKGKDYFWGNIDEVGFQKKLFLVCRGDVILKTFRVLC